ncbi:MAG: TIGR04086 family membrane protein [Lachnospiraceae bacterium]|nr:TIGR04086 family membrane protein [Lachnospiraceae bacterium]
MLFIKDMREKNRLAYIKDVIVSLFGGYVVTFLGIVILAILLLMFQITENTVDVGILIIYILSGLSAGFIVGKRTGSRRLLWGMVSGILYFLVLFMVSLILKQDMNDLGNDLTTTVLICVGSGMLGGILS